MLKRLLIAVLLIGVGFQSFANDSKILSSSSFVVPHAYIVTWVKGSYGNYAGAAAREKRHPMPIWVSISFDKQANEKFVNDYFMFLVGHKPQKHKRYNHIHIVTVSANTSKSEFEDKIDKANRHFDPEIERQEQLAIEEANAQAAREAAELAAAEAEAERKVEEERLRLEAEKKAEEERRVIARAQAEAQARILAVKRERERQEAEKKQRAVDREKEQQESSFYSYSITKLPKDFHVLGGYYAFNNRGQVVGCISEKASLWKPIYQRGRHGGSHCINAHEDKYADAVAAFWDHESGLQFFDSQDKASIAKAINDEGLIVISLGNKSQKKQCFVWDISTGISRLGPLGDPYLVTSTNMVVIDDGQSSIIWNIANNFVSRDVRKHIYMTIDNNRRERLFMMNKKGNSIRMGENLLLQYGTESFLLLPEGNSRILALNDNDQVAALVDIQWGSNTFKAIQLLDKDGNSLRSKVIKELAGYDNVTIIGFNIRGQLLLKAGKDYLFLSPKS